MTLPLPRPKTCPRLHTEKRLSWELPGNVSSLDVIRGNGKYIQNPVHFCSWMTCVDSQATSLDQGFVTSLLTFLAWSFVDLTVWWSQCPPGCNGAYANDSDGDWTCMRARSSAASCLWVTSVLAGGIITISVSEANNKNLVSPHLSRHIQPPTNQCWTLTGRTDSEAEAPIFWPPNAKSWLIGKDPDAGKDVKAKEKGAAEDKMVT